jgi:hypothetical protein
VAGNHGLVCHPGVKGQSALAFERTLDKVFRVAGGLPTRQPSTYSLLGGLFPKDDLSSLFCGNLSKTESEERRKLAMEYLDILSESSYAHRAEQLATLKAKYPKPSVGGEEDNNGIVRFDMKFPAEGPLDCPRELWFDHAIVHETSPTYAQDTLRYLKEQDDRVAGQGRAFQKMFSKKSVKYAALMAVATRLMNERKLDGQPFFLIPIISSLGFMNSDFVALLKFIVERFKDTQKAEPERMDGLGPKVLVGRFRKQLRNSIAFALLKANALATYNQGTQQIAKPP